MAYGSDTILYIVDMWDIALRGEVMEFLVSRIE